MTNTEQVMDKLLRSYFCTLATQHQLDGCECWQLDQCEYCKHYQLGKEKPNYPMPVPNNLLHFHKLWHLGYVSALNNFDAGIVFTNYVKR